MCKEIHLKLGFAGDISTVCGFNPKSGFTSITPARKKKATLTTQFKLIDPAYDILLNIIWKHFL